MRSQQKALLTLNAFLIATSLILGIILGWNSSGFLEVHPPEWRGTEMVISDLRTILFNNFFALALLLSGALSFGVISVVVLVWNSLFLGFNLPALIRTSPSSIVYFAFYGPLEFLAIAGTATVAELIGAWLFQILICEKEPPLHPFNRDMMQLAVLSTVLMLAAGFIETAAKVVRNYGT